MEVFYLAAMLSKPLNHNKLIGREYSRFIARFDSYFSFINNKLPLVAI